MRLEQRDSYLRTFDSRVLALRQDEGRTWLRLRDSAFYPSSGGQPHDVGTLVGPGGSAAVDDVRLADGEVWHGVTAATFAVGDAVHGEIDWPRRRRHMQRHSGQHLLSQAFVRLDPTFETRSVGLRSPICTIDFAGGPNEEQLREAEALVNEVAYRNLPVEVFEVGEDELGSYPLRRPPKVSGRVRLVRMGAFELSACGGTHVRTTTEAAPIKIVSSERVKGGLIRVGFRVGFEALEDYRLKHDVAVELAAGFSSRVEEVPARVAALRDELAESRRQLAAAQAEALATLAARLHDRAEQLPLGTLVIHRLEQGDPLPLARALIERSGTVALLASAEGELGRLLFARSDDVDLDVRPLLRTALTGIGGRGGGRAELAQGAGSSAGLDAALAGIADELRSAGG